MGPSRLSDLLSQPATPKWRPSLWLLHPHTRSWGPDIAVLAMVAIVQINILPNLTGGFEVLDVLTPMLAIAAVQLPIFRAIFLGVVAALLVEPHSSQPAGYFFCSYGIMLCTIVFFRDHVSWRQPNTWLVTLSLCCIWHKGFSAFVYQVAVGTAETSPKYWLALLLSAVLSIGLGMGMVLLLHAGRHEEMGT